MNLLFISGLFSATSSAAFAVTTNGYGLLMLRSESPEAIGSGHVPLNARRDHTQLIERGLIGKGKVDGIKGTNQFQNTGHPRSDGSKLVGLQLLLAEPSEASSRASRTQQSARKKAAEEGTTFGKDTNDPMYGSAVPGEASTSKAPNLGSNSRHPNRRTIVQNRGGRPNDPSAPIPEPIPDGSVIQRQGSINKLLRSPSASSHSSDYSPLVRSPSSSSSSGWSDWSNISKPSRTISTSSENRAMDEAVRESLMNMHIDQRQSRRFDS